MHAAGIGRLGAGVAALTAVALATPAYADATPLAAPTSTATAAPAGYAATGTWLLLAEVNATRRQQGLQPLVVDERLAAAARAWAEHLAAAGTLAHNTSLFSAASHEQLGIQRLAENVGLNVSVGAQHDAFLASPHHRDNLLYPSYRVAGFAVVRDGAGGIWSVEDFGTAPS